jgi:sugar phosphate isomerase/epimerase
MIDWPVGLSTGCFYQKSLFEVVADIAGSGFSLLEICSHRGHLDYHDPRAVMAAAEAMKGQGLKPFSFHAPFAGGLDITSPDAGQRAAALREMLLAVEAAGILGVECFVIHPGPEKEGRPAPEEHRQRLQHGAATLGRIAEQCAAKGVRLVFENMLPHLLLGRSTDLGWFMEALGPWDPGFCLDTGHAHLAGDLEGMTALFPGRLRMLHAADNRGVRDDHLPPGQGGIDWSRLIAQLRAARFPGVFILELAGDETKRPRQVLAEALRARDFIQGLF